MSIHANRDYDADPVTVIAAATTVTRSDRIVLADVTSGTFAVTLPAVALAPACKGISWTFKRTDNSGNSLRVSPGVGTLLDTAPTYVTVGPLSEIMVVCDGANYWISSR